MKIRGVYDDDGNLLNLLFKSDVQFLKTRFFARSWQLYSDWTLFKMLPHGKGTMKENASVISIIRILSEEANLWDQWDMDNRMKKHSSGKRKGGSVTDPMK